MSDVFPTSDSCICLDFRVKPLDRAKDRDKPLSRAPRQPIISWYCVWEIHLCCSKLQTFWTYLLLQHNLPWWNYGIILSITHKHQRYSAIVLQEKRISTTALTDKIFFILSLWYSFRHEEGSLHNDVLFLVKLRFFRF